MRITYNQLQILMLLVIGSIAGFSIKEQQHRARSVPTFVEIYRINPVKTIKVVSLPEISLNSPKEIYSFQDLSPPTGVGSPEHFLDLFSEVAELTGVELRILLKFAAIESSFNPMAMASSSGAMGLFQFTFDTWSDVVKKYGRDFGISINTPRTNARANALMAGFHIKSNIQLLKDKVGIDKIRVADIYLTHLLGRSGSLRYLKSKESEKIALKMKKAAKNNKKFFYEQGKILTRKESYTVINRHIQNKAKEFNIAT